MDLKLSDLKTRFYEVVGDYAKSPRYFTWPRVLEHMNEGVRQFRRDVEDAWGRVDVPTTAGQSTYDFPTDAVRIQRIAFDDVRLEPATLQSIMGEDEKWGTRDATEPRRWTSDGLDHDQYRLWPEPSVGGDQVSIQAGSAGGDATDGIVVTISGDPTVTVTQGDAGDLPGDGDPVGIVVSASPYLVRPDDGMVATFETPNVQTLWYTQRAPEMINEGDNVPLRAPFQLAPLWWALARSYEDHRDRFNPLLSAIYQEEFRIYVQRGRSRTSRPLPRLVHRLGGSNFGLTPSDSPRLGDTATIDGNTVEVILPSRTRFQ